MVNEIAWARDTLNILADHMDDNEEFSLFATLTIEAVKRTRLQPWRTAAQFTIKQAKGK
jgi:hypothetical protein